MRELHLYPTNRLWRMRLWLRDRRGRLGALLRLRLPRLLPMGVSWLPRTMLTPRAVVVMLPAMSTMHPPAPETEELKEHHQQEAEEEEAEEAPDEANAMSSPAMSANQPVVATLVPQIGHNRFGILTPIGQQAGDIPFIPAGLPNTADHVTKEEQPQDYCQ